MTQIPYVLPQLCTYIDRDYFEMLVKRYHANAYVKSFSCWNQLVTMTWAHLTRRVSLRDIECSLRGHRSKLYRMGIGKNVSRNTIAHANARREVAVFRELAQRMMERASKTSVKNDELAEIGDRFKVNGFFAGDSSTIYLDLGRYAWSTPQRGRGGLKLHTLYDLLRHVPTMALLTGHEERDQTFLEDYPFRRGSIYMFDKAYVKTKSLNHINNEGAWFVVRLKARMAFEVIRDMPSFGASLVDNDVRIMGDHIIRFTKRWAKTGYPGELRLVRYYCTEKNELMMFLTNNFTLPPLIIALLYRYRWEIETFFRWIKQHLRIESFFGTSANAVMIQIYIAVTVFCTLSLAVDDLKFEGSLYDFSRLLSTSLSEKVWLRDLAKQFNQEEEQTDKDVAKYGIVGSLFE